MFLKIKAIILAVIMSVSSFFGVDTTMKHKMPIPDNLSTYTQSEKSLVSDADFYVCVSGDDDNCGDFQHPFATIEKAKETVANMNKTGKNSVKVAVMAGDYRVNSLEFTSADSGTADCPITYCAYGDGEVTLNGGVSISPSAFKAVTDSNVKSRFNEKIADKIVCFDLNSIGVTADDYGKIYAIGSYNTAEKYTGDTTGELYCELFVNDERVSLARYPNNGYLYTGKVIEMGLSKENADHETNPDWATAVNPKGDTYKISKKLAKRINSWQTFDDVWMFGFWMYDWADASTPIGNFDYENKTISTKYVSMFSTKENAPYYFFNVLEELDTEGEWYLDRNSGIIYLYAGEDFYNSTVDLSLTTENIISGNVDYVTFDGFTIKGTRSDGVNLTGNNLTIKNCLVKNVAGNAIIVDGYNNLVTECEITHTGRGGIIISGGDTQTLTSGNSKADNNLIHDWSEIYQTYQPAVTLKGVGNICSHNEMYNSPHEAITYSGNNHIIEYNNIHDVCLLSEDAGAIYSGRSWFWYGNIIRYNCIYNIGSDDFSPDGIYLDDALSGQTVYGNLLINIPKKGIHIGGGRDNIVENNIIINTGENGIYFDQRAADCIYEGWFNEHSGVDGDMWKNLFASPWQSEIWQNAYPQMQSFITDFSKSDEAGFVPNPANGVVKNNIILNSKGSIGDIRDLAYKYSTIENNAVFNLVKQFKVFEDPINGDYTVGESSIANDEVESFTNIPISKIGRY